MLIALFAAAIIAAPEQFHAGDAAPALRGGFTTTAQCEQAAASIYAIDRERGWTMFKTCIEPEPFTDLEVLMQKPWVDEVRKREEGPTLVARVIAQRGADLDRDLRACRRAGLKLHTLRAALAEPELARGRLVLVRGSFRESRRVDGERTIEIEETRPVTDEDLLGDGELLLKQLRGDVRGRTTLSVQTGLTVLASLGNRSTVFEPTADYIVLMRFEGERDLMGVSDESTTAIGTVLALYEQDE
jgi:hypothetical protein